MVVFEGGATYGELMDLPMPELEDLTKQASRICEQRKRAATKKPGK